MLLDARRALPKMPRLRKGSLGHSRQILSYLWDSLLMGSSQSKAVSTLKCGLVPLAFVTDKLCPDLMKTTNPYLE